MPLSVDDLVALVANTPSNSQFGSSEEIAAAARLQGIDDPAAFLRLLGIDVPTGAAATGGAAGGGAGLTTTGDPLNVVQGTDFLAQSLEVYLGLLGIGETAAVARSGQGIQRDLGFAGIAESAADRTERGRQFDITSALQQASQLAQLRANPLSAAESAFMRAGLGLDPFGGGAGGGGTAAAIAAMINGGQVGGGPVGAGGTLNLGTLAAPTTRGAGGTSSVNIGGNVISSPGTLSGRQLVQTANSPAAGVIESLAAAAGNPGQRSRSIAALIPTGFPG